MNDTGARQVSPLPDRSNVLSLRLLGTYGFMAFPLAFAGLPIYLHAPDFYATSLGVSLSLLGFMLLGLRLVDAVQDPWIGSLSDRFADRRPLIIVFGLVLLGAGFWMIFHPATQVPLIWFAVSVLLCTTGFSIVSINLQSVGGLWKTNEGNRTIVSGVREAFGLLGLLCAAVVPVILSRLHGPQQAYHLLSLLFLPLLTVGGLLFLGWLKAAPLSLADASAPRASWREVLRSPWQRRFFAVCLLNSLASSIPAVLVLFFIRDRLDAESLTGLFLVLYFLSGAISMMFWAALARRMGKVRAWRTSMGLACITFVWAVFLGQGDIPAFAAICILSGLALGADLALPPAILADHVAHTGQEADSTRLYAVLAFTTKAALALATGITLPLLGLLGYEPGQTATGHAALALNLAYAGLPCLMKTSILLWLNKNGPMLASH